MPTKKQAPKNSLYERFLKEHLPAVPNFVETNAPKFDPGFKLGPPMKGTHDKNFLEFYFNNDVRHVQADIHMRPDHYTQEQKDIIEALANKRPLPAGTTNAAINEIVMRLLEKTEHRKKREAIIQKAQKVVQEDPTIERIIEQMKEEPKFEDQASMPKAIKII